jgi:hypothetical protein
MLSLRKDGVNNSKLSNDSTSYGRSRSARSVRVLPAVPCEPSWKRSVIAAALCTTCGASSHEKGRRKNERNRENRHEGRCEEWTTTHFNDVDPLNAGVIQWCCGTRPCDNVKRVVRVERRFNVPQAPDVVANVGRTSPCLSSREFVCLSQYATAKLPLCPRCNRIRARLPRFIKMTCGVVALLHVRCTFIHAARPHPSIA